jgi:putative sigma-54 modulation protein
MVDRRRMANDGWATHERKVPMKIAVRFLGLPPSEALREHSERQAMIHLGRFVHDLESVEIRVRDVNGPRGGEDMECKVSAKGPRIGFTTMAELSADAYHSVQLAVARLSRTIARNLGRVRGAHAMRVAPHPVH